MVYVCRKEHFSAAHRLYNPNWTQEENEDRFGICANPNSHGHNFTLTTKVRGVPDPDTGCVMDLKLLGSIIRENVIQPVDGRHLNDEVDFLSGKTPSCEVVIMAFWEILAPRIYKASGGRATLYKLELYETAKNFVEYFGEGYELNPPAVEQTLDSALF
mgnify:CR=1 FL=1